MLQLVLAGQDVSKSSGSSISKTFSKQDKTIHFSDPSWGTRFFYDLECSLKQTVQLFLSPTLSFVVPLSSTYSSPSLRVGQTTDHHKPQLLFANSVPAYGKPVLFL